MARKIGSYPLRILWIKTELLHPVDKGGKIRTIEILKRLKHRHHITYLSLDDGSAGENERLRAVEYCHDLICVPFNLASRRSMRFFAEILRNVGSSLPYAIGRYRSLTMREKIVEAARNCDIVVCDFLVSAINIPGTLLRPLVLFQHNVESEIWRRHTLNQTNAATRLFFRAQWQRMEAFERQACQSFDSVIAVSKDDCNLMRRLYGVRQVAAIPTGVDTDFFHLSCSKALQPLTLVFTGSMDWMPNEDAILYFIADIMPLISKEISGVRLVIVGRNPSPGLKELSRTRNDIVVTGRVDDVRPYIEQAHCFVVPIRIGGGTRLKIFEAMSMGKPVVSTTIGAEGLPVTDGTDLLLADKPKAFAAAVVRVLRDNELAAYLSLQAASKVREEFGWDRVAEEFSRLCFDVSVSSRSR